MRTRVEARSLELTPGVAELVNRLGGNRETGLVQQSVDVEHPETDTFHVERADRARECLALRNQRADTRIRRQLTQMRRQSIDV